MKIRKFIKLSSLLLNTNYIKKISIKPDYYCIDLHDNNFSGFLVFSFGWVSSDSSSIDICKNKDPEDYQIIKKWIEDQDETAD